VRIFALSPRLQSVADLVPPGARFADVGTDHAYLPVWLILTGVVSHAIASDLREGPLDRARQTAQRYGAAERMSFRLCDGLDRIGPDEADTIAIAGMGGETIAQILAAAPWTAEGERRLLLQPMTAHPELRTWLNSHNFRIEREFLSCEGKTIYSTFLAAPGRDEPLTPAETWAGRQEPGIDAPLRGQYLEKLVRRAERAVAGIRRSARPGDAARREKLERAAAGLKKMREEWETWQR
jgi:tRNA A22 N-methylase